MPCSDGLRCTWERGPRCVVVGLHEGAGVDEEKLRINARQLHPVVPLTKEAAIPPHQLYVELQRTYIVGCV
jgi:hypothetical protein